MGALTLAVMLSATADAATTHYALRQGMRESNPIARAFIGERPSMVWAFKGAGAAGIIYYANTRPRGQRNAIKAAVAIIWSAVSALNIYRINTR